MSQLNKYEHTAAIAFYNQSQPLPIMMTVPQIAQFLGIGLNSAYMLTRSNKIRSIRIGRQLRIPREALLEFISPTDSPAL